MGPVVTLQLILPGRCGIFLVTGASVRRPRPSDFDSEFSPPIVVNV